MGIARLTKEFITEAVAPHVRAIGAIRNASPTGLTREPGPPEREFKRQADAQMEQAKKADVKIAGVFRAQRVDKVGHSAMTKPAVVAQTPRCPKCQNVNISRARVAGVSGDIDERCGACGWTNRVAGK